MIATMAHTVAIHISLLTGIADILVKLTTFWGSCCHGEGGKQALHAHLLHSLSLLTSTSISLEGVSMATRERFRDGVGVLRLLHLEIGQFSQARLSLVWPRLIWLEKGCDRLC